MILKIRSKTTLLTLGLLLLAGCGFHLRGIVNLPSQLQTLYLQSASPYSELTRQIRTSLKFSNAKLVSSADQAPVTLHIFDEKFSSSQTSVASTNQTRSYTATYSMQYNITSASGKVLMQTRTISSTQNVTAQPNEVLENTNKLDIAKQNLLRNLVSKLLFQLASKNTIAALKKI
jgi:LPS-assembly lipoprotein